MSTSSTNNGRSHRAMGADRREFAFRRAHRLAGSLFERLDADDAPVRAVVLEPDASGNLREDRVVFSEAGIQSWTEPPPALANDDRASADDVPVVRFDAETL